MPGNTFVDYEDLRSFCEKVFATCGLNGADAALASDVLTTADLRGIPSHGVGRLWRYVNGLRDGQMNPNAQVKVLMETPLSIALDADGGMGASISAATMGRVIEKASAQGMAFACVGNSNHFGIAGYYAMMALEKDMIGIAMTNSAAMGVPTFGSQAMFGTNPLAFAAPANREGAFVLDMSTTVVTRGKIEVYGRDGKDLPAGWGVDRNGQSASDAPSLLDAMLRLQGGILPLGGLGEQFGGHKGYGLAVMVDILCSVLCGAAFGRDVKDTPTTSARVNHFFGAMKVSSFREPSAFKADMDSMLERLRATKPAAGCERVYFAGEKEAIAEREGRRNGISLSSATYEGLRKVAKDCAMTPPAPR